MQKETLFKTGTVIFFLFHAISQPYINGGIIDCPYINDNPTLPDQSSYQFNYDNEHRITSKTTPRGYTTEYSYNQYGLIEKVESPTGETREYTPGLLDQLVNDIPGALEGEIIDPPPYDDKGSYTEKKDSLGNAWKRNTNANGQITQEQDPLNRITQYEYNARGNLTKITYPNGSITEMTYDNKGNMLTKTVIASDSEAISSAYTYDSTFNKPTSITDANGHKTTLTYDSTTGDLKTIIDTLNNTWSMTYTAQGLLETITDPQNNITTYTYDNLGNLATKTNALGHTWTYTRDLAGNITEATDPLGNITQYSYDAMNRLTSILDPEEGLTQISYEDSGCAECSSTSDLITSITDPNGHTWTFSYDQIGQLTSVTDPLGNITQRTYDLNRNLKSIIDAETHTTEYFYDTANELTQTLNADGGTIDYTYTLLGKVEILTDPSKNITTFGYDEIGRLTSETDAKEYVTSYQYDKNHNLIKKNTPNGHTITYSYDALNRIIQKITAEQTYAFTYDSLSRLTGASNASSSLSFAYDVVDQLIQSTVNSTPLTVNLSYSYDSAGRKTSLTDPTGTTSYGFDKANRLTSIADPQGNSFTIAYDKAGRRTSLTGPGGLERTYSYDDANRLLELINKVKGVEVAPFQYVYDKVGNRTSLTDKFGDHAASYDPNYRLTELTNALASGGTENFGYDVTGNRLTGTQADGSTQSYGPNELNQITSGTSGLSLSYDANGNVTSKTADGITWSLTWDSENKLTQAQSSDGKTVSFQYDALGRRISKASDGVTTSWICDANNILLEYENGVFSNHYTHGPSVDEPLTKADLSSGQNYFYHSDALGSTVAITGNLGSIVESYRYSSFGVPTVVDESGVEIEKSAIGNRYLFTGREYDWEISAAYHHARYYDPTLARFISKDPIGFAGGVNTYAYSLNNPTNWIDPWGLLTIMISGTYDGNADWAQPGTSFSRAVAITFGETPVVFEWSGEDNAEAREKAAKDLAEFIQKNKKDPCEKVNIVSFSHGGNVVFRATELGAKIDNLVSLGTPIREYMPNLKNVKNLVHVYSTDDSVQTKGGGGYSLFGNEFGSAYRTLPNGGPITNVRVRGYGHSDLHTPDVWNRIENEID